MEEKDGCLNVSHPLPGLSVEVTLEKAPQKKKKNGFKTASQKTPIGHGPTFCLQKNPITQME